MRRFFIALLPPTSIVDTIAAWRETHEFPVRWLSGQNLHVTLVPPWEEDNPDKSIKKLASVSAFPIKLKFNSVDFGPDAHLPRLIWVTGQAPVELLELRAAAAGAVEKPIPDSFTSHITMARFRPEAFETFHVKNLMERVDWTGIFDSWALMESRLLPGGAEYEPIARFELK